LMLEKLGRNDLIHLSGTFVSLASHSVVLTTAQQEQANPLLEKFEASPFAPPDRAESAQLVGHSLLEGLVASKKLVLVSEQILFTSEAIKTMTNWVCLTIDTKGSLSLAEFRDQFRTSRKYAAAFLEYLDAIGVTLRKNDTRLLKQVK
jgi:selenocysteine-specific elongation factor